MSNVFIRSLSESDLEFVHRSCLSEHWNYNLRNIERMFAYELCGCFVAEADGKRIGHVFSISYGKVGWIGLLIVDKEHRRSGVGTLLTKKAMSYLLDSGVETIKLESVSEIANLYRKLGFIDEFDSLRFMRINKKGDHVANLNVALLRMNEIEEIAKFDSRYFGANRLKVLRQIYEDNPELCFISRIRSQIVGYIMLYEAETGYRVGPWVCNPCYSSIARELLLKCIEILKANTKVYIGVPAVNNMAVKILQDLDFKQYSKSIRMYFGKKPENECIEGVFAIGGPEKG